MGKHRVSRRRFLGRVASGGVAVALGSPLGAAKPDPGAGTFGISADTLAAAEKLAALDFGPARRELLVPLAAARAQAIPAMRRTPLANEVGPATVFNPRNAGIPPPEGTVQRLDARWSAPPETRPRSEEDLAFLPIARLSALLRTRQVSSREITAVCLKRLKAYDPVLSAVVNLTEERALRQAALADAELDSGHWRGPLHGVPWGAKDMIAVNGYPTTWGAAQFKDRVIEADAEVVRRLDAAGAVLVAKLAVGALATGDVWFGGRTKCPWNLAIGSAGSSAGSVAAVSAALVPFALGTESHGSIVGPCARNAVTGLRPTHGRVSRAGVMSLVWSMDKVGPIARSAEDCALVFDAIHGVDPQDAASYDCPFVWNAFTELSGQRIGCLRSLLENSAEGHEALETLRNSGVTLVPIELPDAPLEALRMIFYAEAAAAFDDYTLSGEIDDVVAPGPSDWANVFRDARFIPAVEYIQANRHRVLLQREMEKRLVAANVEVWLSSPRGPHVTIMNLTGHPAVCVPIGFNRVEGQPESSPRRTSSGISFNARLYREDRALAIAHAFQRATDWHLRRPPIV